MKLFTTGAICFAAMFVLFLTQSSPVLKSNFAAFAVWQFALSAVIAAITATFVGAAVLTQGHVKRARQSKISKATLPASSWLPNVAAGILGAAALSSILCYIATGAVPFDGLPLGSATPPFRVFWTTAAMVALSVLAVVAPIIVGRSAYVLSDTKEPFATFAFFGFAAVFVGFVVTVTT